MMLSLILRVCIRLGVMGEGNWHVTETVVAFELQVLMTFINVFQSSKANITDVQVLNQTVQYRHFLLLLIAS